MVLWVHFCVTWAAGLEPTADLLPGTLLRDLAGGPEAYSWLVTVYTFA